MRYIVLICALLLSACGSDETAAHYNSMPRMKNDAIVAEVTTCRRNHLSIFEHSNSFGETVEVECYTPDNK